MNDSVLYYFHIKLSAYKKNTMIVIYYNICAFDFERKVVIDRKSDLDFQLKIIYLKKKNVTEKIKSQEN